MTQPNPQITRWRPIIHEVRDLLDLDADQYPNSTVLALIEVESAGDENARRTTRVTVDADGPDAETIHRLSTVTPALNKGRLTGSIPAQFCGLLQMGKLAGQDVGYEERGFRGWATTDALMGDGRTAIEQFMRYQERYSRRHRYQPSRIAALWKAGPGTLGRINRLLVDEGLSMDAAIERAADELGVPNALEYVERFRVARERWAEWVDEQGDVEEVCEVQE